MVISHSVVGEIQKYFFGKYSKNHLKSSLLSRGFILVQLLVVQFGSLNALNTF